MQFRLPWCAHVDAGRRRPPNDSAHPPSRSCRRCSCCVQLYLNLNRHPPRPVGIRQKIFRAVQVQAAGSRLSHTPASLRLASPCLALPAAATAIVSCISRPIWSRIVSFYRVGLQLCCRGTPSSTRDPRSDPRLALRLPSTTSLCIEACHASGRALTWAPTGLRTAQEPAHLRPTAAALPVQPCSTWHACRKSPSMPAGPAVHQIQGDSQLRQSLLALVSLGCNVVLTLICWSSKSRTSYVRCVLKHPVTYARLASRPLKNE